MKTTHHNVLALACALLLTIPVAPVAAGNRHTADDHPSQRDRPDKAYAAPSVSRSDAADIAQRATGGRVLSVRDDGRYWQVKVLVDEKRVRFVNVDKYSGRVR